MDDADRRVLIAVAGAPGTGTTTLCQLLSQRLALPHVYAGAVFRQMAKEHAMTLAEFGAFAESHPGIDRELDARMINAARGGACVLEGRMAAWHVREAGVHGKPGVLTVLLEAPEGVRATRVANREGVDDALTVLAENRTREASEAKRYREIYGFDPNDPRHYDLVIESSRFSPEAIADQVVAALEARSR